MYYTKYRPQKFSELSQPNDVAKALANQIKNGTNVHAYLFVGSRGTGKTTMARLLAKALNCTEIESDGDPCAKCDHCIAIQTGKYLDLIEIDAASNRGIDDIRELKEKIKLAPSVGSNKTYIIDEVHMLTPEAFNALLKTLEEPPAHVTFVLCTTEYHKVPETIRSRCQVYRFKRASISQLTERLTRIAKTEKASIDEKTLRMIASASQGGFRDAETLLQQIVEGEISPESLVSMGTREAYAAFTGFLISKDAKAALHEIDKLNEDGSDLYVWVSEFLKYLRDLIYVQAGALDLLEDDTEETKKIMYQQAKTIDVKELAAITNSFIEAQNRIKDTVITQLPLEIAVIEICNKGSEVSINSVQDQTPLDPKSGSNGTDDRKHKKEEKTEDLEETEQDNEQEHQNITIIEQTQCVDVSLDVITQNWVTIIKEVSSINSSVSALLKSSKLAGLEGNIVFLEVPYDFHKERLQAEKSRRIVEDIIYAIVKENLRIQCTVKKMPKPKFAAKETGKLTDYNVVIPTGVPDLNENVLDVFDGGLPL